MKQRISGRTGIAVLAALFCVIALFEVSTGPVSISPGEVLTQTFAYFHGDRSADAVVMGAIRWPRLCVAALVGAGLAATGTVLQAVFRNAMADPGILGVSSGGSLGAVLVISTGIAQINGWLTPLGAFISGLVAMFLVYRLGTLGGRTAVHALLLSGVAVSAFCSAGVSLLLSLAPLGTMQQMLFWLMGGLDGSTWQHVWIVLTVVAVGLCVYRWFSAAYDVMSIGEEQAEGVGVHLQRVKQWTLLAAAFIVGACVSVSGIISFVGLIVPHLLRLWIGPAHRFLLPASAIGGATLVVASDIVARMVLSPSELNIGIVTSCLGAPFFLYLLRKHYDAWRR